MGRTRVSPEEQSYQVSRLCLILNVVKGILVTSLEGVTTQQHNIQAFLLKDKKINPEYLSIFFQVPSF